MTSDERPAGDEGLPMRDVEERFASGHRSGEETQRPCRHRLNEQASSFFSEIERRSAGEDGELVPMSRGPGAPNNRLQVRSVSLKPEPHRGCGG